MHLSWLVILLWLSTCTITLAQDHSLAGGECEYEPYTGKVKITSIVQNNSSIKSTHELYEVKFIILSMPDLDEKRSWIKGREFMLLLDNSSFPGPLYLKKYGIAVGKVFDCFCHVITRGTCSPIFFTFPEIRLDDYFESQPQS